MDRPWDCKQKVRFKNDSGSVIPPYACMAFKNYVTLANGEVINTVEQPSTTLVLDYFFNGPSPVADQGFSVGFAGQEVRAAYDTGLTPTPKQVLGPKPGSWLLFAGYPGLFSLRTITDGTNSFAVGNQLPLLTLLGKPDSDIAALASTTPGSGTVSVYAFKPTGSPQLFDTTMNVTAYNLSGQVVTAAAWIQMKLINGFWFVDFEACS